MGGEIRLSATVVQPSQTAEYQRIHRYLQQPGRMIEVPNQRPQVHESQANYYRSQGVVEFRQGFHRDCDEPLQLENPRGFLYIQEALRSTTLGRGQLRRVLFASLQGCNDSDLYCGQAASRTEVAIENASAGQGHLVTMDPSVGVRRVFIGDVDGDGATDIVAVLGGPSNSALNGAFVVFHQEPSGPEPTCGGE